MRPAIDSEPIRSRGIIVNYSFYLFYVLLSGLGSLLRMFCSLCLTSAVSNKLYYIGDEPNVGEYDQLVRTLDL